MKSETIKWLEFHLDEIMNNQFAQSISEEDRQLNQKDFDEIKKCIEWVNTRDNFSKNNKLWTKNKFYKNHEAMEFCRVAANG